VTDNAGQSSTMTFTVVVKANNPPVANAGGPYVFGEEAASGGVWTATLASRSQDDVAIFDYEWVFDPVDIIENFPGTTINTTKWLVGGDVTQHTGITVVGAHWWGGGYVFSQDNFDRVDGKVLLAQVRSNSTTQDFAMWGFKDSGTNF